MRGVALLDCSFYPVRDVVAFVHRNVAIHADVKIDVKIQSHLADETFFDLDNTRDRAGDSRKWPSQFFHAAPCP